MKSVSSNKENAKSPQHHEEAKRRPASARITRVEEKPKRQEQRTHASLKQRVPLGKDEPSSKDRDKTPEIQVLQKINRNSNTLKGSKNPKAPPASSPRPVNRHQQQDTFKYTVRSAGRSSGASGSNYPDSLPQRGRQLGGNNGLQQKRSMGAASSAKSNAVPQKAGGHPGKASTRRQVDESDSDDDSSDNSDDSDSESESASKSQPAIQKVDEPKKQQNSTMPQAKAVVLKNQSFGK